MNTLASRLIAAVERANERARDLYNLSDLCSACATAHISLPCPGGARCKCRCRHCDTPLRHEP